MQPVHFPLANRIFTPPAGYTESQISSIPAMVVEIPGPHALEGLKVVIVAWKPSPEDIQLLQQGGVVYISMVGGLAPHFLTTKIEEACYQQ